MSGKTPVERLFDGVGAWRKTLFRENVRVTTIQ